MENRGYIFRQRPSSVLVTSQSSIPISATMSTADSLATIAQSGTSTSSPAPTMATLGQEKIGFDSAQGRNLVAKPTHSTAASSGENLIVADVESTVPDVEFAQFSVSVNVTTDNISTTVSNAELVQSAASVLYTQQQAANVGVFSVFASSVQASGRPGVHTDQSGVHTGLTDQAYDAEVSSYFQDGGSSSSPRPPASFHYVSQSPPRATSPINSMRADSRQSQISYRPVSRQPRAASRQSVTSVHSRASGRLSTHSQAIDPVIELMNKMFDKVAGDAAAQRADVAAQRAEMQVEIGRTEREAADKARLQLENKLLKKKIAAAEKRQITMQLFSPQPAIAQLDVHTDSLTSPAAGTLSGNIHTPISDSPAQPPPLVTADSVITPTFSFLAPVFAYTQHAISAPDCLTSDNHVYPPATLNGVSRAAGSSMQSTIDRFSADNNNTLSVPVYRQLTENNLDANNDERLHVVTTDGA